MNQFFKGFLNDWKASNIRIYFMTFAFNFIFGCLANLSVIAASPFITNQTERLTAPVVVAIITMYVLPFMFILLNFYCFKYCKNNKNLATTKFIAFLMKRYKNAKHFFAFSIYLTNACFMIIGFCTPLMF